MNRLAEAIRTRWAYKDVSETVDYDAKIEILRERIDRGCDVNELSMEIHRTICSGIDGHAQGPPFRVPGKVTPFRLTVVGDRVVAISSGRLVDECHPFVCAIDGVPIEQWIDGLRDFVPRGSASLVRVRATELLLHINFVRSLRKLPQQASTTLELASDDGDRVTREVALVSSHEAPGSRAPGRRTDSGVLRHNVGYLRLRHMGSAAVRDIERHMEEFRETHGLIIDVRGNPGGSRDPLKLMYSYLSDPDEPPQVVNCAVYRLHAEHDPQLLASRHLFAEDASVWSKQERKSIHRFEMSFCPQWTPGRTEFSPWHYMVLGGVHETTTYYYDKPVVVLMDEYCFSATDIFLAALRTLPSVTLMGTPSSGGSSAARWIQLEGPFRVKLGTMVSYQPSGQLFDGNGVLPDVRVPPDPEFFVGGHDNVLQAALVRLTNSSRNSD